MSLQGSTVNVLLEFQSDEDGRNGVNDGFKGIGFNNISLQEYTFLEVASYTNSRTNVDAEESALTAVASHEFEVGVYRLDVKTVFDNTTVGTPWHTANEISEANNIKRVIFNVESVDVSIGSPNTLKCMDDQTLSCVLPIDGALTHTWDYAAVNGVLAGDYMFHMDIHDMADGSLVYQMDSGGFEQLESQERIDISFTPWEDESGGQQWVDGTTYNISVYATLADGTETGNVRCLLYTSPSPRDATLSRMPSSA